MIKPGQLRWWAAGAEQRPFIILESFYDGVEAWWILTPKGRDWEPREAIEEFSEVISEDR